MSVYQNILDWSQSKPGFIKDALRRIISSPSISQTDIDELILLLKKETDDGTVSLTAIPIDGSHIPAAPGTGTVYPKLLGIKNPKNICALHDQGNLQFAANNLTVIYGNNGSGKSSYSRILKKLCWSRSPNTELKKNVFLVSPNAQQVELEIGETQGSINFTWVENGPSHPSLSMMSVFDTDCGEIYVNNENPTEYKPIGIDLLERLVPVLGRISQSLNIEIAVYNTQKPILEPKLASTNSGLWYSQLESKERADIDNQIRFSQSDGTRQNELFNLINTQDPQQNIQNLTNLKRRIENYAQHFSRIEGFFSDTALEDLQNIRIRYEEKRQAYEIASGELNNLDIIGAAGSNPWRALWDAAKNFAFATDGFSDGQNFPSDRSLEKCVFCQQDLDDAAQQRLLGFNQFILNDVSKQFNVVQQEVQQKIVSINNLNIQGYENFSELEPMITDFQVLYTRFSQALSTSKASIIAHLNGGEDLQINLNRLSTTVNALIANINLRLQQNIELMANRNNLIVEYNELRVKEFLFNNKVSILQYFDEYKYKTWIGRCSAKLGSTTVSRKIGELMEDQAVRLQHQEFIDHLSYFNPELASKVLISKTRTTQGNTYQRCNLDGIAHSISSVLSEGEKKVIALSNFLAECTIDGRKNTIIFDDPVTSLDIDYREAIAKKIVVLSADRQIIVLTHDLSFLRSLIDISKVQNTDCQIIGIDKYNGISGIVTDEIPYLAKNVQERINSIRRILVEHDALSITDGHGRESKLDAARKRFRMLLERSVEEILSNKAYERFSKNIHLKKGNLSGYVVTNQQDVDFLLSLFGKYSVTEHDGGITTIPLLPNKTMMDQDISLYSTWKEAFRAKLNAHIAANN